MKFESEFMPTECGDPCDELTSFIDRQRDNLKRLTLDRRIGRKIAKVNSIHIEKTDSPSTLSETVWQMAISDFELHGIKTFRIFAYKDRDGDTEQAYLDFVGENEAPNDETPDPRKTTSWIDVLQTQLRVQQNLMVTLINKLISLSTGVAESQTKTIEHLAGKYLEGLSSVENLLQTRYDMARDERREQARSEATSHIAEVVKGVMPVLKNQIQSSVDNNSEEKTQAVKVWKALRCSISPAQLGLLSKALTNKGYEDLHVMLKADTHKLLKRATQTLMEEENIVKKLEDVLTLEQESQLSFVVRSVFLD